MIALGLLSMMENMFVNDEINNEKQPRFITILIGALLSGVALQATAANTINPDSGTVRKAPAGRSSSMGQSPTALATSIVVQCTEG